MVQWFFRGTVPSVDWFDFIFPVQFTVNTYATGICNCDTSTNHFGAYNRAVNRIDRDNTVNHCIFDLVSETSAYYISGIVLGW